MSNVLVRLGRKRWKPGRDPLRMSRYRWLTTGWFITAICLLLGGGYLIGGPHIILAKDAFAAFPGGIRVHGAVLFALGMSNALGMAGPTTGVAAASRWLQRSLLATGGYWAWSALLYLGAPVVHGALSYTAVVLWFALAVPPVMLAISPPPLLVQRTENDLLKALLATEGITPEQASSAVDNFRGGSGATG